MTGTTPEELVFSDSNGEEIVTQALWDHNPQGNNDCSQYKLERNSLG